MRVSNEAEKISAFGTASLTDTTSVESSDLKPLAQIPMEENGLPAPGKRVSVTEPEYAGTDVHHSLYLPQNFADRHRHPLIVEYTGNYYPPAGSTGRVEDAHLGYALTLGRDFIWVVLPFVSVDHHHNEVTWWGDQDATVTYAKTCIPRIIKKYQADPDRVILCGFSRGAIATSYIGLHDDDIAKLWTAFFTHDHFDGVRDWGRTPWASPLAKYRAAAVTRLKRTNGRPYWISEDTVDTDVADDKAFLSGANLLSSNFILENVPMKQIFPKIPNDYFLSAHTDMWPLFDNPSSRRAREWVYKIGGVNQKACSRIT